MRAENFVDASLVEESARFGRQRSETMQLADMTGGRIYKSASFARLDDAYREVAEELRRQDAIYYTPANKARDGSFRRVHVDTTNRQLRTYTRAGYCAPH